MGDLGGTYLYLVGLYTICGLLYLLDNPCPDPVRSQKSEIDTVYYTRLCCYYNINGISMFDTLTEASLLFTLALFSNCSS